MKILSFFRRVLAVTVAFGHWLSRKTEGSQYANLLLKCP
jgi:hypothetical protein